MYILRFKDSIIGKYKGTNECYSKIREYMEERFKKYYYKCYYLNNNKTTCVECDGGMFYIDKERDE